MEHNIQELSDKDGGETRLEEPPKEVSFGKGFWTAFGVFCALGILSSILGAKASFLGNWTLLPFLGYVGSLVTSFLAICLSIVSKKHALAKGIATGTVLGFIASVLTCGIAL